MLYVLFVRIRIKCLNVKEHIKVIVVVKPFYHCHITKPTKNLEIFFQIRQFMTITHLFIGLITGRWRNTKLPHSFFHEKAVFDSLIRELVANGTEG